MTTDSINALGAAATSKPSASSTAATKLSGDYDSFLKLLTAQVANQDPLEPMDSTTFVSQLAQLSQVEQSIVTNSNLEQISARLANASAMSDVQLIGRTVTVPTQQIELRDGKAQYGYELTAPAQEVHALIKAPDGRVLQEIRSLPLGADKRHRIDWDGTDSNGVAQPAGPYEIEIVAVDDAEKSVSYTGYGLALVEQLAIREGLPRLLLSNGEEVASGQIVAVE